MLVNACGIWRDLERERVEYEHRCNSIRLAAEHHRELDIARTMARHELESDERATAREKALELLDV